MGNQENKAAGVPTAEKQVKRHTLEMSRKQIRDLKIPVGTYTVVRSGMDDFDMPQFAIEYTRGGETIGYPISSIQRLKLGDLIEIHVEPAKKLNPDLFTKHELTPGKEYEVIQEGGDLFVVNDKDVKILTVALSTHWQYQTKGDVVVFEPFKGLGR